jgi:hypothetical protein
MQPDYRASVRRGLIWGIVIAGHIGLVAWLYAMHAVPDYQERWPVHELQPYRNEAQ